MGWSYYGGDEFNGTIINKSLWGIYGDKTKHYSYELYGNNKKQGNAQIYRDQMVTVNNGLLSIRATREPIKTGLRKYEDDPANTDYSIKMRNPINLNMVIQNMVGGQVHSLAEMQRMEATIIHFTLVLR